MILMQFFFCCSNNHKNLCFVYKRVFVWYTMVLMWFIEEFMYDEWYHQSVVYFKLNNKNDNFEYKFKQKWIINFVVGFLFIFVFDAQKTIFFNDG